MQRRATKNTRGPNADEKRFQAWLKERSCAVGGAGITEVHHCKGATFKHRKTLIGHWFCLPLSQEQHMAYHSATKAWQAEHGNQAAIWSRVILEYMVETNDSSCPIDVRTAIADLI